MALSSSRIEEGGETHYTWERSGLDYVLKGLPDVDPYRAWTLMEFVVPGTGALYEIDMLVLSRQALYLVEIKSHPGILTGDARDWTFEHEGRRRSIENPLLLTGRKARALAGLLKKKLPYESRVWVEPLVFVSHETVRNRLKESGRPKVVDRGTVLRAITHGEYPGAGRMRARAVNRPTMEAVRDALSRIGMRASRAARMVGQYQLGELLDEGQGYQEHIAEHTALDRHEARCRSYLAPKATTTERKSRLERAAHREADVLLRLGEHPNVLRCLEYHDSAPLGPALVFERFEGGEPLDLLIHRHPDLSFDDRLAIIQQVGEALHFCHRQDVVHRNLSPSSVLVKPRDGDTPPQVKLHDFQLAMQAEGTPGTLHLTTLAGDESVLYMAPEVLDDPARACAASDVFSLGALTWFVFTGQPPAASLKDRDHLLIDREGLRIGAVRDDLSADLDRVIAEATAYFVEDRWDHAQGWVELLLDAATRPEPAEPEAEVDPYEARRGDVLPGDLAVRRVLGSGGTARVLHVSSDSGEYALKVPHDEGCADRLVAEALVLERLGGERTHPHVVRSFGMRKVGSRQCLLLEYAGPRDGTAGSARVANLADLLRLEGTVGLDYARRFGHDLLTALQYLDEHGVQHRDIKPGNIGFTPRPKKARHLVLFDFSLSSAEATQVTAGTPAYRDPWLRLRGAWDGAADRWAACVVLYEMLTGDRPVPGDTRSDAEDGLPRVRLEAERFDAALRDRFTAFFGRAFAPKVEERFTTMEDLLTEWMAVFADRPADALGSSEEVPPVIRSRGDELPTDVTPATPVETLQLSNRARNALDRAGIVTVQDLLQLPRNHLSAVRGVGRKVAREIQRVADGLREQLSVQTVPPADQFAPEYRGSRVALRPGPELGAEAETLYRLRDAGITNTVDLSIAPRDRIHRILGAAQAERVHKALLASQEASKDRTVPLWIDELLAPRKRRARKFEKHARALLGLDDLPGGAGRSATGPPAPSIAEVGKAFGVARQAIHQGLQKARAEWLQCAGLPSLIAAAHDLLDGSEVRPMLEAAEDLSRARGGTGPDGVRQSVALLRLVTELGAAGEALNPPRLARIQDNPWLVRDEAHASALRALGKAADELADTEPLPSTEKARAALAAAAADTPLASLPTERMASLATRASSRAALSARMEIYPRGMAPERSVALSASLLALAQIPPEEVRTRVHSRYPQAVPLPTRPALDALLEPHGLMFDSQTGLYQRPGISTGPDTSTFLGHTRAATASTSQDYKQTPRALEARAFHEILLSGVERGRFRVVMAPAKEAEFTAQVLAEELGVGTTSMDQLLAEHVEQVRVELGVAEQNVVLADRDGPSGAHWPLLQQLMAKAGGRMVEHLLAHRERPRLLVHPGALARYDLSGPLQALVERAQSEDGAAILLVVPTYDDGAAPSINGEMPVPAPLPGQRLRVPVSWLRNEHRAAQTRSDSLSERSEER